MLYSGAIVVAAEQLRRHEFGFGGVRFSDGWLARGRRAKDAPYALDQPRSHPPQYATSPKIKLQRSSLCLWKLVADRVIEPEEQLVFTCQKFLSDLLSEDSGNRGTITQRLHYDRL